MLGILNASKKIIACPINVYNMLEHLKDLICAQYLAVYDPNKLYIALYTYIHTSYIMYIAIYTHVYVACLCEAAIV